MGEGKNTLLNHKHLMRSFHRMLPNIVLHEAVRHKKQPPFALALPLALPPPPNPQHFQVEQLFPFCSSFFQVEQL